MNFCYFGKFTFWDVGCQEKKSDYTIILLYKIHQEIKKLSIF